MLTLLTLCLSCSHISVFSNLSSSSLIPSSARFHIFKSSTCKRLSQQVFCAQLWNQLSTLDSSTFYIFWPLQVVLRNQIFNCQEFFSLFSLETKYFQFALYIYIYIYIYIYTDFWAICSSYFRMSPLFSTAVC